MKIARDANFMSRNIRLVHVVMLSQKRLFPILWEIRPTGQRSPLLQSRRNRGFQLLLDRDTTAGRLDRQQTMCKKTTYLTVYRKACMRVPLIYTQAPRYV